MEAHILVWLRSMYLSPFSWQAIWFSPCQNKSLPVWITNDTNTLIIWKKTFDHKIICILEPRESTRISD